MGEPIEEVAHVVLWCFELPVVGLGIVELPVIVLAVHPIRMHLPPVGAEHFGDCKKKTVEKVV